MRKPPLSPRLALVYDFIRPGRRVADIGADHAYVCAALALSGRAPACIACELRPGPLSRARQTVDTFGVAQKVELRLSDGLDAVLPEEAEDIVVAGMGGELIAKIVCRCAWLRDPRYQLVLQPMTAQAELRGSLYEHGFTTVREAVAKEGEKLYLVMAARYCGRAHTISPFFRIAGLLPENGDELSGHYLLWQAKILQNAADGLKHSSGGARRAQEMETMARRLKTAAVLTEESK